MKKTNVDLVPKIQQGKPSSLSSSGEQDFFLKKKKSLGSPNSNSPTKLLSKGQLSDRVYSKAKPIRHNSSKSITSSIKPLSSEPNEENNMFDLLSTPIDSKTILQFYKNNIKKRVQSLSSAIGVGNEFADITSSVAFKRAKAKIAKNKAATLLVDRLKLILEKYFAQLMQSKMTLKRDLALNGSNTSNMEAKFIHSVAGQISPRVEIMLTDSSRNILQSRRQLSEDNKLMRIFSPTGINFNPSDCCTETADSPSSGSHRRVLSNRNLPLKSELNDFESPNDHNQKIASYRKQKEESPRKEYFTSLIEEDEFKRKYNDEYQLRAKTISHKRESSLSYLDAQSPQEQKDKLRNRLYQSNTIKSHVLSKFVRLLKRSDGTYTAFRKIKDYSLSANSMSYGEFKLDSPVIKTAVFPTFSNLSPKARGFALNLDKIPENESENRDLRPQSSTKYKNSDESYKSVFESIQKRTMGILYFEKVYSQLVRKQYRGCFEKFSLKGDANTLTLNEGLTVRSALSIDQQSNISRSKIVDSNRNKEYESDTSPRGGFGRAQKGGFVLSSATSNEDKFSEGVLNSRWQLENADNREISALEGRLEKNLERKLDSKIQQNLDENLRGRLASELLKLFSQSITSIATKNENPQNRGSYTERGAESATKLNLEYLQTGSFRRNIDPIESEGLNNPRYSVTEMMQCTPYFQKNVVLPMENDDHKTVENISEMKDYSAISHKEDLPSFNFESPIKQNTKILDTSNLLSSVGRKSHEYSYSPTRIIPMNQQIYNEEERKSRGTNTLSLPSIIPIETQKIKSENYLKQATDANQIFMAAFEKGKLEVGRRVRCFYLLEKVLNKKINNLLWLGFSNINSGGVSETSRVNRFMIPIPTDQSRSASAYSNLSVSTPNGRNTHHSPEETRPVFGPNALALHAQVPASQRSLLDSSRFDISAKHIVMGKLIERLYVDTMKLTFFKLRRSYITKKYQYKPLNKNQTLNYLLFAKKVEKIYKNKIRGAFTQLCFKSTGAVKEKKFDLQKFLIGLGLKMKRSGFSKIRAFSSKSLHIKNSFAKMGGLIHQKRLRLLSETFYFIASYGLVRKEYLINLSMMAGQFLEMRKSRLRDAFISLKEISQGTRRTGARREGLLRHLLKQKSLKTRFLLKYAFLKWSRSASNLSVSIHHEIGKLGSDKLIKAQLFIHLKNIFSSRSLIHKFNAFSKLKHHTSNLKAALGLYTVLNKKIWNSLKFGYDGIAKYDQDVALTPKSMRRKKLERLSRIVKRRLSAGFTSILSHSSFIRQPVIKHNHKEGILRLCVIAEDMKQDFLLHGLKMIELYNIYKRNQKSLYINLGLKLYLLFDEKQRASKKNALDMMFFQFEKNALRQRLMEKLSRKAHQKNLQFFFNRYRNEVVNLKLNYSMVNLAIKDIILAIEKLNKFQRGCKALVFRKLSLLVWEKQQMSKESFNFANMLQRQANNKAFSSIGSIDFSTVRMGSGKSNDEDFNKKIIKGSDHCSLLFIERKLDAFREIQYAAKIGRLAEALENFESNVFQKLVYKRKFLSFAQIKYEHDKRNLRIQGHKAHGMLKIFKLLDKHTTFNKKTHFRRLRTLCDLKTQYLEEKLEEFTLYKARIYFGKWKNAFERQIEMKARSEEGVARLERIFFQKNFSFVTSAFEAILQIKSKVPLLTHFSSSEHVMTEASTISSPTRIVKTQPASQKIVTTKNSLQSSTKSNTKIASNNRPAVQEQPNPEQSPSQNSKRASNRPSFGASPGVASPRTKLPGQSSVITKSTKNSASQVSSQTSSKVSTPSNFHRSTTLKK